MMFLRRCAPGRGDESNLHALPVHALIYSALAHDGEVPPARRGHAPAIATDANGNLRTRKLSCRFSYKYLVACLIDVALLLT
jgi:hypothetical protein